MNVINKINHLFNNYLPWIVLAVAVVAFVLPGIFTEAAKLTVPLLQLVMFCMGLTLTAGSFVQVFKQPWQVILVSLIQFIWMPLAGYLIGIIFNFPPEVAIGFILLGACPGGTASNVMTYLANGDVPLSVTATSVSTLLAPILTPFFIAFYGSTMVEVAFWPMFISIIKIVAVPIIAGIIINALIGKHIKPVKDVCPTLAAIVVLIIIGGVTAVSQQKIIDMGWAMAILTFVACLVQNVSGYVVTYGVCKVLPTPAPARRAMQIEVAMQNSALAVTLALKHFTPAAAICGTMFSIIHNFTGSIFAGICRKHDETEGK